jgi:hypothetical protein
VSLNYHPGVRQQGYNTPPNEGWGNEEWHQSAIGDTHTSHTLPGRLYIVQCEWCPEAFAAPNKSGAMEMFRAHEKEMLSHRE